MSQEIATHAVRDGPTSMGWQRCLNDASSEHDVIGVVRDFLALLTLDEIRELPQDCRPGKIVDADDVSSFAFTLARAQGTGTVLRKMAMFFSNAALRVAQIRARPGEFSPKEP